MTDYIHPQFTPEVLPTFVGYHLQIFTAGRAKISLQYEGAKKLNYFASCPKKDRQALARQKGRTGRLITDHYRLIDMLLDDLPDGRVLRVYQSGNTNKTADNAHVVVSIERDSLWLILSEMVHQWVLPSPLAHIVLAGRGPKTGTSSVFNEYMSSLEHDWQNATFEIDDYKCGLREQTLTRGNSVSMQIIPNQPPPLDPLSQRASVKPQATPSSVSPPPVSETVRRQPNSASDILQDDPCDDPILFAPDPDPQDLDEYLHHEEDFPEAPITKALGASTLYSSADLRKQVLG
jgi:hypothetical protein